MEPAAGSLEPILDELIRQAAQGSVVHNDDTGMRILKLVRNTNDGRTGTFTSGIISIWGEWRIALYFTGWKHAGENLADVLLDLCDRRDLCGVFHWAGAELISRYELGLRVRDHFKLSAALAPIYLSLGHIMTRCVQVGQDRAGQVRIDLESGRGRRAGDGLP